MDKAAQIDALVASLCTAPHVFGRAGRTEDSDVASQIYPVVLTAQEAWEHEADPRAKGPQSASDIAEALETVAEAVAIELLVDLSVHDLVFLGHILHDAEHALRAVRRLVSLLGHGTTWWTSIELPEERSRGWRPVTKNTFDGVVAGVATDGTFVILLQVGED